MESKRKLICPICNQKKRNKCFIFNRIKNETICRKCNRTIGSNIFYVPFTERKKDFIGKFSMSNEERRRLYGQLIRQGMNPEEAGRKISFTINYMKGNYFRKKGLKKIKELREQKKKQMKELNKKKFLEGLK
jgi:hypothetical protein